MSTPGKQWFAPMKRHLRPEGLYKTTNEYACRACGYYDCGGCRLYPDRALKDPSRFKCGDWINDEAGISSDQ